MQFFLRRSKPEHLDHERLSSYLDGELRAAGHGQVEQHLEGCEVCRYELQQLQETVDLLRSTPMVSVPRSFALLAPVISGPQVLRAPLLALRGTAVAVALALMVMVIGDGSGIFGSGDSGVPTQLGLDEPVPAIRVGTEPSPEQVLPSPGQADVQGAPTLEAQGQGATNDVPEAASGGVSSPFTGEPASGPLLSLWPLEVGLLALLLVLLGAGFFLPRRLRLR